MKVNISNNELIITPETVFENSWLIDNYPANVQHKAFLKKENKPLKLLIRSGKKENK